MIKTLELKKAIVDEERVTLQKEAARRVKKISQSFTDMYVTLGKKFDKYKEFMVYELESHEQIRVGLEKEITRRENEIDELKEALSIPRQHYKFISNKTSDEIIEQKNQIVQNMANTMGVPPEKLLDILYQKEAAKLAK